MKKILSKIFNVWYKTSDINLRDTCRNHIRTNDSWRYIVTTHNMEGVSTYVGLSCE